MYADDADVQGAGQASCRMPGEPHPAWQLIAEAPAQQFPQPLLAVICQVLAGEVGGGAQADRQVDVLGPGPHAAFLPAPGTRGPRSSPERT
jgi:hypothetical protein